MIQTTDVIKEEDSDSMPRTSEQVNTKIIIIVAGSIICSVLVFVIIYELQKFRNAYLPYTSPQSTNTECVYAEVNEVNVDASRADESE
jgi:hypothetical protein